MYFNRQTIWSSKAQFTFIGVFSHYQVKHGSIQFAFPELQNLYQILEVDFHPLNLHKKVKPVIEFIEKNDDLVQYVPQLEDIIITRVLKQASIIIHCLCSQNVCAYFNQTTLNNHKNIQETQNTYFFFFLKFDMLTVNLNLTYVNQLLILKQTCLLG